MIGSALHEQDGLITVCSTVSLAETVKGLLVAVERRGMAIYAKIDYTQEAERVGFPLRPARLFIFGYIEAEAPVIAKCQLLGIDFPHRVLVWEDDKGSVWVSYNDPIWLGRRHRVDGDVYSLLEAIGTSLTGIVLEATQGARQS
jgi:uncharacterized protein (DUF302 family)